MPVSQIIHKKCSVCNKLLIEAGRIELGNVRLLTYTCGHVATEDIAQGGEYAELEVLGYRPYQIEGVKFAEQSNFRCLIADEQGLGKTWQAVGTLKLHKEDLTPAIVITKTTIKHQWWHEVRRLLGNNILVQVINSNKERALPGFDVYVMTYDLAKEESMFDMLIEFPETLIIDECQAIKNHETGRAKAIQKIAAKVTNIIALSGTPIKNNAGEYFTILNILQPTRFPQYERYLRDYCDSYETLYGHKVGGLANREMFNEDTKDFIIRRTREEAAPELPKMDRQFYHVELDKRLNSVYRDAMKELDALMYSDEDENTMSNLLAIYAKLRKITGLSKAAVECVDFTTEFLESTDRKIVIFLHHHAVATQLESKLNPWLVEHKMKPILNLNSSLNGDARAALVERFKNEDYRVMIASTLAAGEGLNLQFCSDAIMLERQWNPANEEQAEGRFTRLGRSADAPQHIRMVYMIATETIDEYFTELVEAKRAIVSSTLNSGGPEVMWDTNNMLKELAGILLSKGKERWKL